MKTTMLFGFADPVSSWTHLIAAVVFFLASGLLVHRARGNVLRVASVVVYSVTVVFLLSMSGVYHLLETDSTARSVLRQLDHAGIWMLIAGTFTPFHVILFRGFWRWGMLFLIWSVAITGMVLEIIFIDEVPEVVSLAFYLSLGWVGLISGLRCLKVHENKPVRYLALGGVAYSLGALIDFNQWLVILPQFVGHHEIFHFFVVAGVGFHWHFIYHICSLAITARPTVLIKVRKGQALPYYVKAQGEDISFAAASLDEAKEKLYAELLAKYHAYRLPQAVRLQFVEEHFLSPSSSAMPETPSEHFFPG